MSYPSLFVTVQSVTNDIFYMGTQFLIHMDYEEKMEGEGSEVYYQHMYLY